MLTESLRKRRFNRLKKELSDWIAHTDTGAHILVNSYEKNLSKLKKGDIDLGPHASGLAASGFTSFDSQSAITVAKANVMLMEGGAIEGVVEKLNLALSYSIMSQLFAIFLDASRGQQSDKDWVIPDSIKTYVAFSDPIANGVLLAVLLDDKLACRMLRDFLVEVIENEANEELGGNPSYLNLAQFIAAMILEEPLPDMKAIKSYAGMMEALRNKSDLLDSLFEVLDYHINCAVESSDSVPETEELFGPYAHDLPVVFLSHYCGGFCLPPPDDLWHGCARRYA